MSDEMILPKANEPITWALQEVRAGDPVAIGIELVFYMKAYNYSYVREQPKK